MRDTMPYADLIAIYSTIADKSVTRFDMRANGGRRIEFALGAIFFLLRSRTQGHLTGSNEITNIFAWLRAD